MEVRIERLPAMWVASVHASGESPEAEAWRRLREWAAPKGLLNDPAGHPIFGFNNPPPSPASSGYGYELWVRVDGLEPKESVVKFKEFAGGLFAVTTCRLLGDPDVGTMWRRLWDWAQTGSSYRWRRSQELERVLNPNAPEEQLLLDLYLPVQEEAASRASPANL